MPGLCAFRGAWHCSSVTFQEEVAQSEMVMVYLPNSTGVDRLGIASLTAPTRMTTASFKNSVVYCLEVLVCPSLMPTVMVTMDPIDVDYHNQLIYHLPAGSRSIVGCRTNALDLAADCQQPSSLPNTMVADCLYGGTLFKSNSRFFLLPT